MNSNYYGILDYKQPILQVNNDAMQTSKQPEIDSEKMIYDFEEEHGLEHFTSGPLSKRKIASQTRFRLLVGVNHHWLNEDGLFAYLEALYYDTRPCADKLIERTNVIINSGMDFWYKNQYTTCDNIIKDIEIGDLDF